MTLQFPSQDFPLARDARTARPSWRQPLRMLYAFDPRRTAILIVADDKTGDDRWYDTNGPIADRLFEEHLRTIEKERAEYGYGFPGATGENVPYDADGE